MITTAVKERPILFSGPMVRAILDGRKTQTRRIVKPQPERKPVICGWVTSGWAEEGLPNEFGVKGCSCKEVKCRYHIGDRLWVRESFADPHYWTTDVECETPLYATASAQMAIKPVKWRPSIHMPRCYSRITLEITDVRVQFLQEISHADALAEGVDMQPRESLINGEPGTYYPMDPTYEFAVLWNKINGPDSWNANPWVWAISFKRI